ncbi:MAG TPA: class I SAM-dependent methyltransferase [Acidimicrobiales bacterium]|jgi:SAM-dependent methyltransferase
MSPVIPRPDPDPSRWTDPSATYDRVAPYYADRFLHELDAKPFDRDFLSRFAAAVGPRASEAAPVCDLGCGPGHLAGFLSEQGLPVIGIDLSAGMVEEARRRFPAVTFAQGDMTSLGRPDASFSGLVCFYALIHLPRSRVPLALGEMRRVLAGGAPLLLAVHGGSGSLHASEMVDQPADLDATLFSLPELTGLLEAAGFALVEAHERAPYEQEAETQRLYAWAVRSD